MRISGIELNDDARLVWALTRIKGVGWSTSKKILKTLKMDESKRVGSLSTEEVNKISGELEKTQTEGDLIRVIRSNVSRLKTIGSYKGIRHSRGLPARGQRTRSNARTKRGKRQTVGSYKKDVLSKMKQEATKK